MWGSLRRSVVSVGAGISPQGRGFARSTGGCELYRLSVCTVVYNLGTCFLYFPSKSIPHQNDLHYINPGTLQSYSRVVATQCPQKHKCANNHKLSINIVRAINPQEDKATKRIYRSTSATGTRMPFPNGGARSLSTAS